MCLLLSVKSVTVLLLGLLWEDCVLGLVKAAHKGYMGTLTDCAVIWGNQTLNLTHNELDMLNFATICTDHVQ